MAISTEFNYADKLALDKARLISRSRLNDLGSYELVIQYNNIPSTMREDALEWLEANRLQLTNPTFSFKTYEGEWDCASITYDEARAVLRQLFKLDVGVGNLGDTDSEPDYSLQTGDLSRISDGMQMFRSYYWRVTNPEDYDLPNPDREGEIWTKTANDNADGTYDVIISKEVAQNQTASSYDQLGESASDPYPGESFTLTEVSTNNTEQSFVSDGGSIADASVGEIKRIQNTPLENGKFRTTVVTQTAIAQRVPPESEAGGPNYPWLEYGSDYVTDANNIIVGKNQPWSQVLADRDRTNISPAIFKINSMTVRPNAYGLFDYTIISNTPG